jgi:uncharacterized cupredoxin-like copper-binding protein
MMSAATRVLAVVLVAVGLVACGGETAGTADNPRTIEVQALDELRFDPSEITVKAGETIRFVVSNPGALVHEFVLGPENVQMAHEEAMQMDEMHGGMEVESQLAALELQPGETQEATVTFEEQGQLLYGCHEAGHYDAGMVGSVIIEG